MTKRSKMYLGISTVLVAIGVVIFSAMQAGTMYYMTVDEAAQQLAQNQRADKPIRMKGKIDQASISFDIRQPLLRFQVKGEQGSAIWIEFTGVKPDNMVEAIDAIVEGTFDSRGVFVANTLMMTCPSTYESGKPAGTQTIVVPKAK